MTKPLDILTEAALEDCLSCPPEKLEERFHNLMTMVKLNSDPNTERDGLCHKYTLCCSISDPKLRHELLRLFIGVQKARWKGYNTTHRIAAYQFYPLLEDALGLPAGELGGATGASRDPGGLKTNRDTFEATPRSSDGMASTAKSVAQADESGPELVFQFWEGDSGIFLKKEDYVRLRSIRHALETASTWGEFERLCPMGEFEALALWHQRHGEYVYKVDGAFRFIEPQELKDFLEDGGQDYVITPERPFDSSLIPGVEDADYPPWLACTAHDLLPMAFRERFEETVGSPAAGVWQEYPAGEIDEMVIWLEREGFSVIPLLSFDPDWRSLIHLAR